MKLNKFVPLTKMEEQADGSLHVYGTVTAESPDLDNEVCDYATTKPLYEKRTSERWELTSKIDGMTPSLMAMRGQHDVKQAIGAGRSIVFDDSGTTIKMGFHVVDTEAVKKWKAGVFIGFSQGGEYVNKWADPVFKGCTRYTADPIEVSAVDAPCLPSALVETMKGRAVQMLKLSGVTEEVHLQTSPVAAPAMDLLGSEKAVRGAFACGDRPKDARKAICAAAEKVGIVLSARDKQAANRACAKMALEKGLYEVGWLGDMLESLHWLCLQTEFERDMEDDGSKVPEGLRAAWTMLIAEFKAMAIEEADELAATGGKGEKGMKITDQAGLEKAAKSIMDHLNNAKDAHAKTGEHIEKCMKACKDAMGGDEPEKAAESELSKAAAAEQKAQGEAIAALTKTVSELTEKLAKTPAGGSPQSGAGEGKTVDAPAELTVLLN